jgi:hypothetical protein
MKQRNLSIRSHHSLNKVPCSRPIHHSSQYLFGRDHAQRRCSGLVPQQQIKGYLFPEKKSHSGQRLISAYHYPE